MSRLSKQQKECLSALMSNPRQAFTPGDLAEILNTSPEGAATTASSLIRRGSAHRIRQSGRVAYRAGGKS